VSKILGGSASRTELYGLFIAAVILIGGGVSGAVVLSSSDETPSAAVVESESTTTMADNPVAGPGPSTSIDDGTGSAPIPSVGTSTETIQPRTTVSIAGLNEAEARIVQEYVERETEAQRQARLELERQQFRDANPASRFISAQVLSCTPLQAGAETLQLVEYRLRYEAYQPLDAESYVNPRLSSYQGERQQLIDAVNSAWRIQPARLNLNLSRGIHSTVFYGLLLPSGGAPDIEVRLIAPRDSAYGDLTVDLPAQGKVCG
jgi:hypothetical protein